MDDIPYSKEDFHQHLSSLLPPGFYLNQDGFLVKDEADRKIIFSYSYTDVFPLSVSFSGGGSN